MMTQLSACFLAVTLAGATLISNADPLVFFAQLIRGTDHDTTEEPTWKPVGEGLSGKLQSVFRWKKYWEVSREKVTVKGGKATRARLSKEREIEIELTDPETIEIRLFRNGVLTRKTRAGKDSGTRILGGDKGGEESWFVVIRKEAPPTPK